MNHKLKVLTFPNDRLIGYLHLKEAEGIMEFHGRFKKDGDLLEGTCNPGWRMVGEAKCTSPTGQQNSARSTSSRSF